MIRIYTVFSLLYKIPFTDRQWMKHDLSSFTAAGKTCPYCGTKGCLDKFRHYDRYLIGLLSVSMKRKDALTKVLLQSTAYRKPVSPNGAVSYAKNAGQARKQKPNTIT